MPPTRSGKVAVLPASEAAGLAAVDILYVARGRIPKVHLTGNWSKKPTATWKRPATTS
jgi:hypothetical protein